MNAMTTIRRTGRMLGADEELRLFARHRAGDGRATRELIDAHMPLIHKIAGRYSRFGPNHEEMAQEGVLGFIQGLDRFDPERGFRVNTLCRWWVRATVTEWVRGNHSIVKIGTTAAQKKAFGSLSEAKSRLGIYDEGSLTADEVARLSADLGLTGGEVEEMNVRLSPLGVTSLDVRRAGTEGEGASRVETMADDRVSVAAIDEDIDDRRRAAALTAALDRLDARKREIVTRRYLSDRTATLEELSDVFGVSRERIRQLEVQAIEQLGLSLPAALSNMSGQERRTARRA